MISKFDLSFNFVRFYLKSNAFLPLLLERCGNYYFGRFDFLKTVIMFAPEMMNDNYLCYFHLLTLSPISHTFAQVH